MSTKVSFIIVAKNKYSKVANAIRKSTRGMQRQFTTLKQKLGGLSIGFKKFGARLGLTKAQLKTFSTTLTGIGKKVRGVGLKMSLALSLPIALMVNAFKNSARDAEETRSKYATVFQDLSAKAESVADVFGKSFGLAGTKARELLGNTGDLLSGFGFAGKEALSLSLQVNELAVDLASFTNYAGGAEGASNALTKALLGETESLKMLGVAILQKDVKQRIGLLRAKGQRFATERQAKAYATLSLAVEQSKNAIGDFARTQHQLANQERITSSVIQDLKESFGRILLPVALKVTIAIRKFAKWLIALSPATKKVILVISGIVFVLGPLLIVLGSIAIMLPILTSGFVMMGIAIKVALWPLTLIVAAFVGGWVAGKRLADLLRYYPTLWNGIGEAVYNVIHPIRTILELWSLTNQLIVLITDNLKKKGGAWEFLANFILAIVHPLETVTALFEMTMHFAGLLGKKLKELSSGALDGLLSLFGIKLSGDLSGKTVSQTSVDINLRAPQGTVQDIKQSSSGQVSGLDLGINMQESMVGAT